MKSPWDVLGVDRNISPEDLKKTYKKLALQFHPDRNPGDSAAEDRFKEITAAYEHISSGKAEQEERAPFGPDMSDFEEFFRRASGFSRQVRQTSLSLSFQEYCLGANKTIDIVMPTSCTTCSGVGAPPGGYTVCAPCNGTGSRTVKQGMMVVSLGSCPACRGRGRTVTQSCSDCAGSGEIDEQKTISIQIPPLSQTQLGLNIGTKVQVQILLSVDNPQKYELSGKNVHSKLSVPLKDALFGTNVDVETVHGTKRVKIPPMEKGYTELRLKGLGAGRQYGDHIVEVTVMLPESDDDRVKIKSLLDVEDNPKSDA